MGPKFIADSMLGKLARWLRMSGYDVVYSNDVGDEELLELAASEGRVLLTRDKDLYQKALKLGLDAELMASNDFVERLRQLKEGRNLIIRDSPLYSRCPMCNGEIEGVEKAEIRAEVPEEVFKANAEFWRCRTCKKLYWHGSHWTKIGEVVRRL